MTFPPLDPSTLLLSTAMLGYWLALTCLCASLSMKGFRRALGTWSQSLVCGSTAFILYWLRDSIPWGVSFGIANLFLLGFPALGHLAYSRLLGVPAHQGVTFALVMISLIGVLGCWAGQTDISWAVVTLSAGITVLLGRTAWLVLGTPTARSQPVTVLGQLATIILAVSFAVRGAVALRGNAFTVSPAADSSVQVTALLVGAAFLAMATLGFIALAYHLQQLKDRESSQRDGLTGVFTRKAFVEHADSLLGGPNPQTMPC